MDLSTFFALWVGLILLASGFVLGAAADNRPPAARHRLRNAADSAARRIRESEIRCALEVRSVKSSQPSAPFDLDREAST